MSLTAEQWRSVATDKLLELLAVEGAVTQPEMEAKLSEGAFGVEDVDKLQIAELAAQTGFTPVTLRYYEQVGLLEAPERSQAGYRLYSQHDVERVRFIGRAKRLGLSLEEIRLLVAVWAGGECGATRRQLQGLVETKIDAVRTQLEDAATFLRQLESVQDRLADLLGSGATTNGCECVPELPHIDTLRIEPKAGISAVNAPRRARLPARAPLPPDRAGTMPARADGRPAGRAQ